jgi:hypothetical protein
MSVPCANAPQNIYSYVVTVCNHFTPSSRKPNHYLLSSAKLISWVFYQFKSIQTVKSIWNKSWSRISNCYSKLGRDLQVQCLKRVWMLVYKWKKRVLVRCSEVSCQVMGGVSSAIKASRRLHRCAILNSTRFLRTTPNRISHLLRSSAQVQ